MKPITYLFIPLFLASSGFANEIKTAPVLGTYSAATEADWTVGFELRKAGKAIITTAYTHEYDEKGKRLHDEKTVPGSWEFKHPHLILSYDGFKDRLIQDSNCYEKRPCFKYDASMGTKTTKSPLNVNYEFINIYE